MTSDKKINYEYTQMLGAHAFWTKKSLFADISVKIQASNLLDDLRKSQKGKQLASQIYFGGLDKFVCRGFKYEFLGFA